jgi:DNA-binding NarL/FixJ family response regulator
VTAGITLVVADDHPIVRDGIRGIIESDPSCTVLELVGDGRAAVRAAERLRPDVVLMDLRMPGMDGVEATDRITSGRSGAKVLVLTTYDTDDDVLAALEAGATGYLLKDAPRAELLRAVHEAAAGRSVLSPGVATTLVRRVRAPEPTLTDREVEVVRLVAAGVTNREIAARLFVSEATVKTHLQSVFQTLGVPDRAAAVAEAFRRKLID